MPYVMESVETKCPNPKCDAVFTRTTFLPGAGELTWECDGERFAECHSCGVELEELFGAVAEYRVAREEYLAADESSERAFRNFWHRSRSGMTTSAGRATHLANLTNYKSADLSGAESALWRCDVDPRDVDRADGTDALADRAV